MKRLIHSMSLAGSLALAATPLWAAGEGPIILERWAKESETNRYVGFTYGDLSYDDVLDRTTLRDAQFTLSLDLSALSDFPGIPKLAFHMKMALPEMHYTALREDGERYYAKEFGAATVNVTFEAEDLSTEAEAHKTLSTSDMEELKASLAAFKLTVSGIRQQEPEWAKFPELKDDPERPISRFYPIVAALVDGSVVRSEIKNMTISQPSGINGLSVTRYDDMVAENAVSGNIGSFTVGATSQEQRIQEGDFTMRILVETGGSVMMDYNQGAYIRQFDPALPVSNDDTPYEIFLRSYEQSDFDVSFELEETFSMSIASLTASNMGIRPPSVPLLERLDGYYLQALEDPSVFEEEERIQDVVETLTAFYGMFRLGEFAMNDLSFSVPGENVEGGMGRFLLAGLSSVGLDVFALEDIRISSPDVTGEMGRVAAEKILFPEVKTFFLLEDAFADSDIPTILKAYPKIGLIEIRDVSAKTPIGPVGLDSFQFQLEDYVADIPTSVGFAVESIRMPVETMDREVREPLTAMGFENVDASFNFSMTWEEAAEALKLNTTALLQDGGQLDANAALGGVPRSLLEEPTVENGQGVLPFLTFLSAAVSYQDDSLVARSTEAAATMQDTTPAQVRNQLLSALPFALDVLNNPEFVEEVRQVADQVLTDGGGFLITMTPDNPVSLLQVGAGGATAPGVLIDLLNVAVEAQ